MERDCKAGDKTRDKTRGADYGREFTEDDFYVVKKGDTLDTISLKIYGNTGHVEAICKMNGLSDGNLILSDKIIVTLI